MASMYPSNYLIYNAQTSKGLQVVVAIDGVTEKISLGEVYTRIRYGDPDLLYGTPGAVYGGLRRIKEVLPYLTLNGSLTIQQRLEPEQGRASITTFNLVIIDKADWGIRLISPGGLTDELLGDKEIKIYLGFQSTSFPEDYLVAFRGTVASTLVQNREITLGLVDPNQKRRQPVFRGGKSRVQSLINPGDTTLNVVNTGDFHRYVIGPDGEYDPDARLYVKIENEWIYLQTPPTGSITATTFTGVSRNTAPVGATANGAVTHNTNVEVSNAAQLGRNFDPENGEGINGITLALKMMLSGWAGPWITGQGVTRLGSTGVLLDTRQNVIVLPEKIDANADYGLTVGDHVNITGSAFNDGDYLIEGFDTDASGTPNKVILIDTDLTNEIPSAGLLSFRSKYDSFPATLSLKMTPREVDVLGWERVRQRFFSTAENKMKFLVTDTSTGKEFIEKEILLPLGAYSLTRYGRLSVGFTAPPAPQERLIYLTPDNIVDPTNITFSRALNNRRFFNEIDYDWDITEDGRYTSASRSVNAQTLATIGQLSLLPIKSRGLRSDLGAGVLISRRSRQYLSRYANAAFEIKLKVAFSAGSIIESGDVVVLVDNGFFQLPNLASATRNIGEQLFEVLERNLDIKTGVANLTLLSGITDTRFDRYGSISQASRVSSLNTSDSVIRIVPSYGQTFDEYTKWKEFTGLPVRLIKNDYTFQEERVLVNVLDTEDLIFSTPFSIVPDSNYRFEIANYPTSTDAMVNNAYKIQFAYLSPSVLITAVVSSTVLTVSSGDIGKFFINALVNIRSPNWVRTLTENTDTTVSQISGNNITLSKALPFTAQVGDRIEFIGFQDQKGAYRIF